MDEPAAADAPAVPPTAPAPAPPEPQKPKPRSSVLAVIFWLIVFPPTAFVMMWRDVRYHSWFGTLTVMIAVANLLTFIPLAYSIYPAATASGVQPSLPLSGVIFLALLLAVAGILLGLVFRAKARSVGTLSVIETLLLSTVMLLQFVPVGMVLQLYVDQAMMNFNQLQGEMIF